MERGMETHGMDTWHTRRMIGGSVSRCLSLSISHSDDDDDDDDDSGGVSLSFSL